MVLLMTLVYALSIADRYVGSTLMEPIEREFHLSDSAAGFLSGAGLALFYCTAAIPLGALADRTNRRNMIALSLAAWSVITVLCGVTRSFWQLLLARVGVGIGEAGATPAQQSLLADMVEPRARAVAMTLFSLGASFGSMLGSSGGGWLNERFGWRGALIGLGTLGIPLALLVRLTVEEPIRGRLDAISPVRSASLIDCLRYIRAQRSLWHVMIGATIITFWGWGLVWWTPAFLTRSHHLSVGEAGALLGPMHGFGGSAVMIATMGVMALLARRDVKYQAWFICLTTVFATLPSILVYATASLRLTEAMLWLFVPLTYLYVGPTQALIQNLTPAPMRAQVVAILLFTANVANLVLAPQLIGLASDIVRPALGDPKDSLRLVLLAASTFGLWGAAHYALAARYLREDLMRAGGGCGGAL